MSQIKRSLVFLSLAAAVAAGAALHLRRGPHAAQTDPVPELVSLVPPEATLIAFADLTSLHASPFLTKLAGMAPAPAADREYAELVSATGFDYTRDLDRVVVAAQPTPSGNFSVVLAEGRFDREKIASYLLRSGKLERQSGVDIYVVPPKSNSKAFSLAFLDANRVALTDGASLAPFLARRDPGGLDPTLREHLARVAGAAFFAVGRVDGGVPKNLPLGGVRSDQLANLSRSLRWFALAARPESDRLRVVVEGECDTAENARQLAGTLDGLRVLAQVALSDPKSRKQIDPQVLPLLDELLRATEVSRDDLRVRLQLELTPQMLEKVPAPKPSQTPNPQPPAR